MNTKSSFRFESLESRNLFAAAVADTSFSQDGETLVRFGGTNESAEAGAVLTSGRLLVMGFSGQSDGFHVALAAFNRDGTLSNSFDGDGKLLLPTSVNDAIGYGQQLLALPDGNALIVGDSGIAKVLAKGGLDKTFGKGGTGLNAFLQNPPRLGFIKDASVDASGTIRVIWVTPEYDKFHVTTFNAAGAELSDVSSNVAFNAVDGSAQFLSDGTIAVMTKDADSKYRLHRFDRSLKPIAAFGASGIDVTPALKAFLSRHPISSDTSREPVTGVPYLTSVNYQLAADGSVAWQASFLGTASGVSSETDGYVRPVTRLSIVVGSDGKRVGVYGGANTGSGLLFVGRDDRDTDTGVNGRFLTTAGQAIDVSVAGGNAFLHGSVTDTDRSVYVFGHAITSGADNRNGFVIASVKPVEAQVTGLLFNDLNGDGIINTETKENSGNGGKVVYLDTNGNNLLDADEYSTVTDASGRYYINGLAGGDYRIRRVNAAGYQYTTNAQRYNQTQPLVAGTQFDLPIGSINKGIVQGLLYEDAAGQIGPRFSNQLVFLDLNKNGKLDSDEPSTKTDSTGFYRLLAPKAGTVRVTAATPTGFKTYGQPKGYSDVYLATTSLVNVSFSYRKI